MGVERRRDRCAVPGSGNNGAELTTAQTPSPPSLGIANGRPHPTATPVRATTRQSLVELLRNPANVLMLVLLTAGVVFLFWGWFVNQSLHSWGSPDWSHAFLVPVISAYLLWQSRAEFERSPRMTFWPGVVPLLLSVWCYVFFTVGVPNHLGQGLALILCVFGLSLLLLGPAAMRSLFLPIAYLGFAITLPEMVMIKMTFPLQLFAAEGGYVLLRMLGVQADLTGNIINITNPATLKTSPMSVAEACSGMRMLIAFVALGAAVALVATRMWWKRISLILLAVPVALFLNVVRVAVLGFLTLWDAQLSQGEAHTFIGTLLLIPGFLLYMAVVWTLHKAVPEQAEAAA